MSTTTTSQALSAGADTGSTPNEVVTVVAAMSALVAGTVHLVLTPHHFGESVPVGWFFLLVGLGQVTFMAASRWALPAWSLLVTAVAHVGLIGLYVLSRTVSLPFVPPHDVGHTVKHLPIAGGRGNGIPIIQNSRIEQVGLLDVICLGAELVLVVALASLLPTKLRDWVTGSAVVVGLILVAARIVASPL